MNSLTKRLREIPSHMPLSDPLEIFVGVVMGSALILALAKVALEWLLR